MKINIIAILLILILRVSNAQIDNPILEVNSYNEKSLALGYAISTWENSTKDYHLIEIEHWSTKYENRHYFALCKYFGTEIGINTEKFILGPKIGVSLNYGPLIFGAEAIYYTDFDKGTLKFAPILGYGNHIFKLSFSPQIRIFNRSFEPVNRGQINLAFRLIKLKKNKLNVQNTHQNN